MARKDRWVIVKFVQGGLRRCEDIMGDMLGLLVKERKGKERTFIKYVSYAVRSTVYLDISMSSSKRVIAAMTFRRGLLTATIILVFAGHGIQPCHHHVCS